MDHVNGSRVWPVPSADHSEKVFQPSNREQQPVAALKSPIEDWLQRLHARHGQAGWRQALRQRRLQAFVQFGPQIRIRVHLAQRAAAAFREGAGAEDIAEIGPRCATQERVLAPEIAQPSIEHLELHPPDRGPARSIAPEAETEEDD